MKPNLPDWKQDQAETSRLKPKPAPSTTAQCGAGEALLPCPFCGGKAVDRREIDGFPMIYCNGDNCFGPQTTARNFEDALVQWNTRSSYAALPPGAEAVVSIQPMQLSGNRTDYFVSIRVADREVTPHVFREEYKAAYHVALYDWLLNGRGEEPDCVEFGPNDWPARVAANPPGDVREKVIDECAQHFAQRKFGRDRYLFPDEIADELRSLASPKDAAATPVGGAMSAQDGGDAA